MHRLQARAVALAPDLARGTDGDRDLVPEIDVAVDGADLAQDLALDHEIEIISEERPIQVVNY
jgi:hypothetical protein